MLKGSGMGILFVASVLVAAGLAERRSAARIFTVVEREGGTVVIEEHGGARRVVRLREAVRLPPEYRGLAGASEGDVFRGGEADPAGRSEARQRVRRLQGLLTARGTQG
jgi:hypothetical protein